jgi:thiosulfate/3-mercaptopyruvate sulfurtransferase
LGPLVSTDWLASHARDASLRIVDVRWYLDPSRRGIDAYESGHIPGAVFMDVDADLSAPGGRRGGPIGRHPWPSADQIAAVMGRGGIDARTRVVAYDDQAGGIAARLWYVLRAYGHDRVGVLDGGIAKWIAEGRPIDAVIPEPRPSVFEPRLRPGLVATKPEVAAAAPRALILDARVAERYRGDVEPVDPRPGHIPGARNAPYTANLTAGPTPVFEDPEILRERYAALGADGTEPIVYCGSGVTACHDLLALEVAGLRGRLYAGSWSEWSSDPSLPAAQGDESDR